MPASARKTIGRFLTTGLLIAAQIGAVACAQEFQPYSSPRITAEQWLRYLALVKAKPETTEQALPEQLLLVFTDHATHTQYTFTTPGHPAHPACITRQVVDEGGELRVRQVGYFAGSEERFAELFDDYVRRNAKVRDDVKRKDK